MKLTLLLEKDPFESILFPPNILLYNFCLGQPLDTVRNSVLQLNCKQKAEVAFEYSFKRKKLFIIFFFSTMHLPNISGRIRPGSHGILNKLCNVFDPTDMRFSVFKFFATHRCSNSLQIF